MLEKQPSPSETLAERVVKDENASERSEERVSCEYEEKCGIQKSDATDGPDRRANGGGAQGRGNDTIRVKHNQETDTVSQARIQS